MACLEPAQPDQEYWQSELRDPIARLTAMYNQSKFTDLTISFQDEKAKIKVHRLILAMSSPVFEQMFFGPLAEGEELVLPNDPPEAFNLLIKYIYQSTFDRPNTVTKAIQVYEMAKKYQIGSLADLCSQNLQCFLAAPDLDNPTLFCIYDTASIFDDSALQEKCIDVLNDSAGVLLSSPDICYLKSWSIQHLLQQQELNLPSEVAVYQGLLKWGTYQASKVSPSGGERSVRKVVEKFLPLIRFLAMTLEEFVEHVMPSDILTSDESSAIMMNIKKVEDIPLPEICSLLQRRRKLDHESCHQVHIRCEPNTYTRKANYDINENIYRRELARELLCPSSSTEYNNSEPYAYDINDPPESKIIDIWSLSTNIHLGGIMLTVDRNCALNKIIISTSDGLVIRELQPTIDTNFKHEVLSGSGKCRIKATLDVPLNLAKCKSYSIHLQNLPKFRTNRPICLEYGKALTMNGCFCAHTDPVIYFWCFKDLFPS